MLFAAKYVDNYEITPEYHYQWSENEKKVVVKEKPWLILNDEGKPAYSLLPPPIVVALIKQITKVLNL